MERFFVFRVYQDPLEAEWLIEILQKHNIAFERSFKKSAELDDYVGSNPFDTDIVIKIEKKDFSKTEAILNAESG